MFVDVPVGVDGHAKGALLVSGIDIEGTREAPRQSRRSVHCLPTGSSRRGEGVLVDSGDGEVHGAEVVDVNADSGPGVRPGMVCHEGLLSVVCVHSTYTQKGRCLMSERDNPWIVRREHVECEPTTDSAPALQGPGAWRAGAEVIVPLALGRSYPSLESRQRLWLVGAHGGAGTSTWARLVDAGDAGCQWPSITGGKADVIVVCRSNMTGLEAARKAGMQWAAGAVPDVNLVGLLINPDIPGRLPKALRLAAEKTAGAFPTTIYAPWVEAWRLSVRAEVETPSRALARVLDEVLALRKEYA